MKKILIAEDDAFIRDLYRRAFSRSEYDVQTAADGFEAIEKIKNLIFDIILLDIMLPKISGIDVLKAIRDPQSKSVNTPVFLITNLGQDDIIKEAFAIGADGYLLKSQLTPQDVVKEINAFFVEEEKNKNISSSAS